MQGGFGLGQEMAIKGSDILNNTENVDLLNTQESQQLTQSIRFQEGYTVKLLEQLEFFTAQVQITQVLESENPQTQMDFCPYIILQKKKMYE